MPVASVMRRHSAWSFSKPSQLAEVPLFARWRDEVLAEHPALDRQPGRRLLFETLRRMLSAQIGDSTSDPLPYVGLGYTGLSQKGGWGISADLGLVAEYAGTSTRPARSLFGVQGMDNAVRDLRLSPVLQVGISYAF